MRYLLRVVARTGGRISVPVLPTPKLKPVPLQKAPDRVCEWVVPSFGSGLRGLYTSFHNRAPHGQIPQPWRKNYRGRTSSRGPQKFFLFLSPRSGMSFQGLGMPPSKKKTGEASVRTAIPPCEVAIRRSSVGSESCRSLNVATMRLTQARERFGDNVPADLPMTHPLVLGTHTWFPRTNSTTVVLTSAVTSLEETFRLHLDRLSFLLSLNIHIPTICAYK